MVSVHSWLYAKIIMQNHKAVFGSPKDSSTNSFFYLNFVMSLKLRSIGDVWEGKGGILIHNLMGPQVEGLALESFQLQILQDEVVGGVFLVDDVLHGESIADVHAFLFGKGVGAFVLGNRLVGPHHDVVECDAGRNGGMAVAAHQRKSAVDAKHILLDFAEHPFIATKDVGDVSTVVTRVVPS